MPGSKKWPSTVAAKNPVSKLSFDGWCAVQDTMLNLSLGSHSGDANATPGILWPRRRSRHRRCSIGTATIQITMTPHRRHGDRKPPVPA